MDPAKNRLQGLTAADLRGFQWLNEPPGLTYLESSLVIGAPPASDFFVNPEDGQVSMNAPVLFQEVSGDFVATALVQPDFSAQWNACALMVHHDQRHWIKFAFENTDATGVGIVSVVTDGVSDDANGPILNDEEEIWLRLIRKGGVYAMHWSRDGQQFHLARLATLPGGGRIKVGVEAQCPVGEGARHTIKYFSIESRTVADLRKGE
jgi:regulation of enolase protein 1 (concanavalin A-like superfamily)